MNTQELAQYIKDNGTRLPDREVVALAFELAEKVLNKPEDSLNEVIHTNEMLLLSVDAQ